MQQAVSHYLQDPTRNKVAAYRSAYDCSRMTVHVVAVRAAELFRHPLVSQVVQQAQREAQEEAKVDAAWVLKRLKLLADFNISKFLVVTEEGKAVYDFSNATDEDWYCIDEYTTEVKLKKDEDGFYPVEKVKVKAVARLRVIEMIGKLTDVKAFSDTLDVNALVATTSLDVEQFKEARRQMLNTDDC